MKKNKHDCKCYMCSELATSREHVPPLCLFPEEKDINTSEFRKNLITVPSCNEHNSKKSNDDEFLMASLASVVGNNRIAFIHTQTKVKRALESKKYDFIHVLMKQPQSINIKVKDGPSFPVLIGRPDFNRLYSCFLHIGHGLYYHKFGKQFEGECHVLIDFLIYEDKELENYKLLCRKRFEVEENKPKIEGTNPQIFKYEFFEPDEFGLIGLRITFYEGAKVFVAFQGHLVKNPYNLAVEMIKSGIKTKINFDDGTSFDFN